MNQDFTYTFGAVLGTQNGRPYYQATVPFRALASMLKLDDHSDVNKRSQRLVDTRRAKYVAKYLEKNKEGFWVIPPLVGFIEGDFKFDLVPLDGFGNAGKITVSLDSKVMLFDGQHRAFGIREALGLAPELSSEFVSIMFFHDMSLSERKQAFHDINYTQKTPSAAICIAYNERNDFDKMLIDTFSQSDIRHIIEYEKNTVSGKCENVYSLKNLKDFATNVCGKSVTENAQAKLELFTKALFTAVNIPAHLKSIEVQCEHYSPLDVFPARNYREHYIIGHAVTLKAFGLLGAFLLEHHQNELESTLATLNDKTIFNRHEEHWRGRCVNEFDKMVSNQLSVRLTFYKLKQLCGLALTEKEQAEEDLYFKNVDSEAEEV